MWVFMNFEEIRGPYGGANAFLRTLRSGFEARAIRVTNDPRRRVDVALLNGLTNDITPHIARSFAERGVPVVHRLVGYRVSGSEVLRARDANGIVHGDRLQLEFSPWVRHTVFQSTYSRDVFVKTGFEGPSTIIHNGVDESVFNQRAGWGPWRRRRDPWSPGTPLQVVVSSWSTDPNKGFADYALIDRELGQRTDVQLTVVGRVPPDDAFEHTRVLGPYGPRRLARVLRRSHVLLQLARFETCSNSLIEGINCGLPVIYLDSGSNAEVAGGYGVEFRAEFSNALDEVRRRYDELFERTLANPYRSEVVVPRYVEVLERVSQ